MKLQRVNFDAAARAPLSEDDAFVLNVIYQSRLRTFLVVFTMMAGLVLFRASPYILGNEEIQHAAAFASFALIIILPALYIFFKGIWAYRRDIRAGFKYVIYQEVIGKQHFPHTGQYFLSLTDVNYMHHEVEQATFESIQIGDRYPVFFAAHSRYPFTLRSRITMM